MIKSKNVIAVAPGATIKEQLEYRGISQKEFALRMDMSEKHISKLINGEVYLTYDVAQRLEMVFGISASFWNNLESIYRQSLHRVEEENNMEEDLLLLKKYPYSEMAKLGWVEKHTRSQDKVISLRKYFEVARLSKVSALTQPAVACRKLGQSEKAQYALMVWVQKVRLEAREQKTNDFSVRQLKKNLSVIRKMSGMNPEVFIDELKQILNNCGITIVFLPHLEGSYLHGVSFVDRNKIIIGMTLRGKTSDKFWFSLFHELGHIVKKHVFNNRETTKEEENEADIFAENQFIPPNKWMLFIRKNDFSETNIIEFSKNIEIDPGIVVGRLQKEELIGYDALNELKRKYELYN